MAYQLFEISSKSNTAPDSQALQEKFTKLATQWIQDVEDMSSTSPDFFNFRTHL